LHSPQLFFLRVLGSGQISILRILRCSFRLHELKNGRFTLITLGNFYSSQISILRILRCSFRLHELKKDVLHLSHSEIFIVAGFVLRRNILMILRCVLASNPTASNSRALLTHKLQALKFQHLWQAHIMKKDNLPSI